MFPASVCVGSKAYPCFHILLIPKTPPGLSHFQAALSQTKDMESGKETKGSIRVPHTDK